MGKLRESLGMLVPSMTMFFASSCVMILELVASRLVAQDLGSSLYTWTSILGVVLAGISVGTYIGGRIADRYHARRSLAVLFGLSSAACVASVVFNNVVGDWTWLWQLSWPVHVFLHVALVFLVPSTLLGTISPVVAKMALDRGLAPGRTVGVIYAWGAAGGIAGTFLAGFFLIARFGSIAIIWSIGAALLVMALLYWVSCLALHLWGLLFGALATMGMAPADWAHEVGVAAGLRMPEDPTVIYEDETSYCHLAVRQVSERPDRRAFWQDQLKHGELIIGDVTNLQCFYAKIYAALTWGLSEAKTPRAMMVIGGGGYAFPQYLNVQWPDSHVEVIEIDPGVTKAAIEAFGLSKDTTIQTVNMDARNYVDQVLRRDGAGAAVERYGFVYADVIHDSSVPFQLVTKEFNDKMARLLADDGVYLVNLIDTYENGRFLGAVVSTLEQTFPCVYVIGNRVGRASLRDTFIVVATARQFDPAKILRQYSAHLPFWLLNDSEIAYLKDKARHLVLTDDYAPVENLLTAVVRQGATERLARKYLREAAALQKAGQRERSVAKYQRAMELDPSMSIKACNAIGCMRIEQDNREGAAEAFRKAIAYQVESGLEQTAIASVHKNLGMLLRRMDQPAEGRKHLAEAVKWFRIDLRRNPNSVVVWDWLGDTLVVMGDLKGASDAFERAVALEPENADSHQKLAKALELQDRYDEAIAVARRLVDLLKRQDRKAAVQMSQYVEILEYKRVKQRN